MDIKTKLTRLTEDRKLTVISRRAGMPYQTVYGYVKGRTVISCKAACRFARVLGVDVEWLIDDAQAWPPKFKQYEPERAALDGVLAA